MCVGGEAGALCRGKLPASFGILFLEEAAFRMGFFLQGQG